MPDPAYPRDLIGYGRTPPDPRWPGGARLAVQIVLNYEEGGESHVLHGDPASEIYLHEVPGGKPLIGQRNLSVESVFEYGSRAGFWRLMRLFQERRLPITVYAVAMALARHPDAAAAMVEGGHEVASHGWRWIDYQTMPEAQERAELRLAIETIQRLTGSRPLGWYTGRDSPNTRRLVVEEGGFLYDSDYYGDDLPFWTAVSGKPHLVIPYTLDNNDMKFCVAPGFTAGDGFFEYLRDAFDVLYAEGERGQPKMMSIGLHCRLVGRPGRFAALCRFLDHAQSRPGVWFARRVDIARHWIATHPYQGS